MKRKLVKQGNNALTITLPKQWLDRYKLRTGDDITISEKEHELVISAKPVDKDKKIQINLDRIKEIIPKYLHSVYRQGLNEVELNYSTISLMDEVHKTLAEDFIGYEVVEQHENKALIRSVAEIKEENFDSMFRRVFRINLSMLESLNVIINEKNTDAIESARNLENVNNKLTNFCRRCISKRLYEGQEMVLTYCAIEVLERMADEINYILEYLDTRKRIVITPNEIKLVDEAYKFFKMTHLAYFNPYFHSFVSDAVKRKHLIENTLKIFHQAEKRDFYLMHYLINIVQYTVQLLSYKLQIALCAEKFE